MKILENMNETNISQNANDLKPTSDENKQENLPALSLPKGGGAITGIGEKFAANPVNGTGSMTVPIYTSPGRSGFAPQLSLSYNSGEGNGPFGLGWSLSLPAITRKTAKGLPEYNDGEESDIFILSGTEDLVPILEESGGEWTKYETIRKVNETEYCINRYRPRIEGLFARIEKWTNTESGEIHWRSISKENITTLYGKTSQSRISDPENPLHVFSWLISESYDDKGNAMVYEYKVENSEGINISLVSEKNRTETSRAVNQYPKRIKYGNKTPHQPFEDLTKRQDWMFEVVFDYGEHYSEDKGQPTVFLSDDNAPWQVRQDSFSRYRAGFEIRTSRLCQRVLMFHHFSKELGIDDYLVRSTEFTYDENPIASLITGVTQSGYVYRDDGTYLKKSLPSIEFGYSKAIIQDEIKEIDSNSLENLPVGLDGVQYKWVDLEGEGISGILTEQGNSWYYKRNISAPLNDDENPTVQFAPLEKISTIPSTSNLSRQQLMDLNGNGKLDLVAFDNFLSGYFERTAENGWESFIPFASSPNISWQDPNLKFVDLTGDGHGDILITEDQSFTWYHSLAEKGFEESKKTQQAFDEEKGPKLVFADSTQSIHLADFSGDGLTDLVRIRNGDVCYWPNLGYGKFGAKITMNNSPWFDVLDQFDQKRIRLADIDGSGAIDIIYFGDDGVKIFYNESGNSWSNVHLLQQFPRIDNFSSVRVVDLLGNGTACLVWSSPLSGDTGRQMRYIDLMGGVKPHLLISSKNNMGSETYLKYVSSTKFYLADKIAGKPWITKLPFPVHVVERVETYDRISLNRYVTRYAYHHGYFDGIEREFRGFGMVEQFDTEEFAALNNSDSFPDYTNIEESSHIPPVLTKTWFHTGAYFGGYQTSLQMAHEYYGAPKKHDPDYEQKFEEFLKTLLPDTILPDSILTSKGPNAWTLSVEEKLEASRSLKGSILRQEVYAHDSLPQSEYPYSVSESNYSIENIQIQQDNAHAVFFVHPNEAISYHYERNPADPRISHNVILEVDSFGNVIRSASVGYGRRQTDDTISAEDQVKQKQTLITCTENNFTNFIDFDDDYRTPLSSQSCTYEVTGLTPKTNEKFDFTTIDESTKTAIPLAYEMEPSGGLQKRLIEKVCSLYKKNDLTESLVLGEIESLALPFESYKLAFTPELITKVYDARVNDAMLSDGGKYVHFGDANWWIRTGLSYYSPNSADTLVQELDFAKEHFFLPHRFEDSFGNNSIITYDKHVLLPIETRDPLDNIVTVRTKDDDDSEIIALDYRVLQPWLVKDPNGNRVAVSFDAMGLVVGTAVMGKEGENMGDSLEGFESDLDEAAILSHIQNPLFNPKDILKKATTCLVYDLYNYQRSAESNPQPNVVYSLVRETHESVLKENEITKIQHQFSYSDGFGREIQKKIQAEPGDVDGIMTDPRWIGSGWMILNNKGKPVKKYEPFFSNNNQFEFARIVGVSSTLFYDPLGRLVATLNPNHTYGKVVFNPWKQETWDVNDTILVSDPKNDLDVGDFFNRITDGDYLPSWYDNRIDGQQGDSDKNAAIKAAVHSETPIIIHFDSIGRSFQTVVDNGVLGKYSTSVNLDIEGNKLSTVDALDRIITQIEHNMLGNIVKEESMDAGTRWMLQDIYGQPMIKWDDKQNTFETKYDSLRRPIEIYLKPYSEDRVLIQKIIYGEEKGITLNHRGQIYRIHDSAGVETKDEFDFKGNVIKSSRTFSIDYKNILNWSQNVDLQDEVFTSYFSFDALNRSTKIQNPDNSFVFPKYNKTNLLDKLEIQLKDETIPITFIKEIKYDSKNQRQFIEYGNDVKTNYDYDRYTFRLIHQKTTRGTENLQDFLNTFDPVGNITKIYDDADKNNIIYFQNKRVDPSSEYTFDAIYRLMDATGREHFGQINGTLKPPTPTTHTDSDYENLPHPNDGNAMGRYTEKYVYDAVGNILEVNHQGNNTSISGWTRKYLYDEPSLIEPSQTSNRLSQTSANESIQPQLHDSHGNITKMYHLSLMRYDYRDKLIASSKQIVNNGGTPEITYYVYDGSGNRVRKITEKQSPAGQVPVKKDERIYTNNFEIYKKYEGDGSSVKLERQTLHLSDNTKEIALIETRTVGDDGSPYRVIRYQISNHLGSSALEIDENARIISKEEFYPYGSTSFQSVSRDIEVPTKRYRYIGKERDEENSFYYIGARYYSPWLGRWISCDPSGTKDGFNLYEYSSSNPILFKDISGTEGRTWSDTFNDVTGGFQIAVGTYVGIYEIAKDTVVGGVTAIAHPIDTGTNLANFVATSYNEGAEGEWGVIGGVANVGYDLFLDEIAVEGSLALESWSNSDYVGVGKHGVKAALGVAEIAASFTGVGAAVKGKTALNMAKKGSKLSTKGDNLVGALSVVDDKVGALSVVDDKVGALSVVGNEAVSAVSETKKFQTLSEIQDEIHRLANESVESAKFDASVGDIKNKSSSIGTRAHTYLERSLHTLDDKLQNLESPYFIQPEEFRDRLGDITGIREKGTIGGDYNIYNLDDPDFLHVGDLKVNSKTPQTISGNRQGKFIERYGQVPELVHIQIQIPQ